MEQNFETCLYNVVDAAKIQKDEPMKKHTTFRIGGPADYFIMPSNEKELAETIRVCREFSIPIYIVGNGSNLLVGDKGFRGAIIQLYKSMGTFQVEGNQITAQAGCSLAQIANAALDAALTGFEFAAGIPGTLGGAVVMNAGAYGGEMKDVLTSVRVMTEEGEIMELPAEKLGLGYRTSIIPEKRYIVLGAVISLTEGKKEEIKAHGEVSTYCEEVKFYSEAAKRYEAEIKKLVQAMPEVKAGLVIDRRDNYGKLADMILAEVLKENGKRGLVDAGWRPTWDMKKMGF